jgi:isocitrate dehydrogenase kinase/phosphatase
MPLFRDSPVPADGGDLLDSRAAADAIEAAYLAYRERFREITHRARTRFERREWKDAQGDAAERLLLYKHAVDHTVADLEPRIGEAIRDPAFGRALKQAFSEQTHGWSDAELAGTFYNSVVRRVCGVVGVNRDVEFLDPADAHDVASSPLPDYRTYAAEQVDAGMVGRILKDFGLRPRFRDIARDAAAVAARIEAHLRSSFGSAGIDRIEMLPQAFYRNKAAYLVGRICRDSEPDAEMVPLVLPLNHREKGIEVDAVLLSSDDASIVFGFTRSYFHVEIERPRAVVAFLRSIMPLKPLDEIYTAIGYHKHGKRELYRQLQKHLKDPDSRFEHTAGKKGLVMVVFTLPAMNVVFKVIRDVFGPTKESSRRGVMDKYRLVFFHDRVGRLADAQQFEHLEFRKGCFTPALLDELLGEAANVSSVSGDTVVVEHLYTERRVTPLDIYLHDADPEAARAAVIDYGNAIRDLAAANIFPGDMLLKNFGVTRHSRVIFYDYDELSLLTDINFRRMPEPRDPWDEMASEPWFHVGEHDVFPEEFLPFLLPPGPLRDTFLKHHAEILDVNFWKRMQQHQQAHDVIDFYPYPAERRLGSKGEG